MSELKWVRRTILALVVLAVTAGAAVPVRSAGAKYFDQADATLRAGAAATVAPLAEKAWATVRAAGVADPGFLDGVYNAARIFASLGREARAEAVYAESEELCDGLSLRVVRLRVQFMRAYDLILAAQYVKAESILRAALAVENHAQNKSSLYVAFLQSLAFVRDREGDLEDAEVLYRMTLNYPASDLSQVVSRGSSAGMTGRLSWANRAGQWRRFSTIMAASKKPRLWSASN